MAKIDIGLQVEFWLLKSLIHLGIYSNIQAHLIIEVLTLLPNAEVWTLTLHSNRNEK